MEKIEIVPATKEHLLELSLNMADDDVEELMNLQGLSPLEGLEYAMRVSHDTKAGLVNGKVLFVFGTTPVDKYALGDVVVAWLLGSKDLPAHKRAFIRFSLQLRDKLKSQYRVLCNTVDAKHTRGLRWLEWLGFTIRPAAPYGASGAMAHTVVLGA